MPLVRIETLGCRLNQIESESIARFFLDDGFEVRMGGLSAASEPDDFTVLSILNTCAVTQKAEQKGRRLIRLMLKKYPRSIVLVTGCYAQLSALEISRMDPRIVALGGQLKSRISQLPGILKKHFVSFDEWNLQSCIDDILERLVRPPVSRPGVPENSFILSTSSFVSHSRASLKIQDGCNCSCSYCTINKARGRSVSLPVEEALARVRQLEAEGQGEVVITSVHIGQYRSDYDGKLYNFPRLLGLLLRSTERIYFRISSIYPEVVTDEFCSVIADKRVQPHFHISVQSGSDKILSLMNRSYTADEVRSACVNIRKVRPEAFLAADIITGFPGEDEEAFSQTLALCTDCGFAWIHAFPFSERPGTAAVSLPGKVPQSVSGERAGLLARLAVKNKLAYIDAFVGKELLAVIESSRRSGLNDGDAVVYHAVTENFIHCEIVSADSTLLRRMVKVRILRALPQRITKGGETEALAELA